MFKALSTAAVLLLAASPAPAETVAFINARIIPVAAAEIEKGTLVVTDGSIAAVGASADVAVPAGARVVDCAGMTIMPGLICTHSHIGGVAGADGSSTIQPDARALDSINTADSGFRRAWAGGLTSLNIMPGSGHLNSGQTIYVKLRGFDPSPAATATDGPKVTAAAARTIDQWFYTDASGQPMGGMKFANGTNPMRDPPFAGTRGKAAAMIRQRLLDAAAYREKHAAKPEPRADSKPEGKPEAAPSRDLGLEALAQCLSGQRVVHHHTHRADDIMTVLRIAGEFKTRVVLHHVSEADKVAAEIAAADTGWSDPSRGPNAIKGTPCSIILIDSPGGKLEAVGLNFATGGVLERAGVTVAFHTDDWITDSRLFLRMAALAVRAGMSREGAIAALTLNPAKMLDLAGRTGSLTPGKDADFIVLTGDPFSTYTKVAQTWVQGRLVFDRANPADLLYAQGGMGAGHDQSPYFCCADESGPISFGRSGLQYSAPAAPAAPTAP